MKSILKKLRSKKGESFVEILIAILVIAFAVVMVSTLYTAAFHMNVSAKQKDDAFFEALQKVEQMNADDAESGSVKIDDKVVDGDSGTESDNASTNLEVDAYKGDGLTSFREKEGA